MRCQFAVLSDLMFKVRRHHEYFKHSKLKYMSYKFIEELYECKTTLAPENFIHLLAMSKFAEFSINSEILQTPIINYRICCVRFLIDNWTLKQDESNLNYEIINYASFTQLEQIVTILLAFEEDCISLRRLAMTSTSAWIIQAIWRQCFLINDREVFQAIFCHPCHLSPLKHCISFPVSRVRESWRSSLVTREANSKNACRQWATALWVKPFVRKFFIIFQ